VASILLLHFREHVKNATVLRKQLRRVQVLAFFGRLPPCLTIAGAKRKTLLPLASSDAAAWVCRAVGLGSSGYAGAYDIVDAKLFALRQSERRSPLPVCTLVWCRPGG
jgi:hypothetical protein